ncbi:acyl-CoA esterase [Chelonobacter oris]|uniref:Acyl-CoA esterase n=1 Tax=Chelonobacter oris TaxID=505317 RepID=A0A0A3APZ1_9PAST|nr:alpha/beta fold hydrolase [Chelonobacter oris]KGQ69832.1 acyl-CoA esterase [Chelonobacter oris]MDH2999185.1 acyl-CoA esterase [Chelonobacter oris]
MTENPLLNHQLQQPQQPDRKLPTLVFLHGLFGDMNNLGVLARAYYERFPILRVDLRNHGHSFHSDQMDYALMAEDVIRLLDWLQLDNIILIGHSMGGKTAMRVASTIPQRVEKLVVLDIAPISYQEHHHDDVFAALLAVQAARPANRQQAKPILSRYIQSEGIQQFMLKSFSAQHEQAFLFNLTALYHCYPELMAWQPVACDVPTLFIKGGKSDYILPQYRDTILAQFPNATSFTIAQGSHWIHADHPNAVINAINRFLSLG